MKFKSLLFLCSLSFLVACGEAGVESGQPAIVPPAPTVSSFTASPDRLEAGQSSALTWELAGGEATSVTISGVGKVTGSSTEVTPSETTTYTLTVRNESGSDSATQTVTVTPDEPAPAPPVQAPVISSFTATPETVEEGESSTLTWELSGGEASSITIDNGVGEVTSSTEVTPSETTTYTLTATNEGGEDTAEVTLNVSGAATVPPEDEVLQAGDVTLTEEGPFIEVDVFGAEDTLYPSEGYTFPEIDISAQPNQGEAFVEDGAIFYDSEDFVGTTTFEYTLSITNEETGEVLSDSGTVTLNVEE